MIRSKVVYRNGTPYFSVDGEILPPCAYITYFEEHNEYRAFAENGFRLFSVSVTLASQPINTKSGFSPQRKGVFDRKGEADYSGVDAAIALILENCPDALIFPRIYMAMPQWWIEENPRETVPVPHDKRREALYSRKYREDGAAMLRELIGHFRSFFAADHIFGYQISGGNTQEWFHLDLNGSYHENALPYFNEYLTAKGLPPAEKLPDLEKLKGCAVVDDPLVTAYIRFANESAADTVAHFCRAAKEAVGREQIVGSFYGYALELDVFYALWGSHALAKLLDSPDIDFFSSPNSYVNDRAMGIDWPEMIPTGSLKLHGKMGFMELDIRTHLSKRPDEVRPDCDPYQTYHLAVWDGPPTEEESVWAVRKALAREITGKNGLWWFDMFGHWYATPALMAEMRRTLGVYAGLPARWESPAEVAVFVDETAYAEVGALHPTYRSCRKMRAPLGSTGVPYDLFLASDLDRIDWKNAAYKAVFFLIPGESAFVREASEKLRSLGVGTLAISAEKPLYTPGELADFYRQCGVFFYGEVGDVVYVGNGYAALHSAEAGKKRLRFPRVLRITDAVSGAVCTGDEVIFDCRKHETKLFKTEKTE